MAEWHREDEELCCPRWPDCGCGIEYVTPEKSRRMALKRLDKLAREKAKGGDDG